MTAICASKEAGQMEGRYAAVVVCGVLFSIFGLFAGTVMPFCSCNAESINQHCCRTGNDGSAFKFITGSVF
ncbi:hypothetical protein RCO48_30955 [Peribacillus frigoritolerans]|nr:hypothetical protein [Peribacillus frigoritolerans]